MTETRTDSSTWAESTETATRTHTSTVSRVLASQDGPGSSLRFHLQRLRAGLARRWLAVYRRVRETLNPAGWMVVASVVVGALVGPLAGWALGWFVLVGGLVLLVCSVPFLLGGHDFDVRLRLERDRVVVGMEVDGVVEVVNASRRPALPAVIDVPVGEGLVEAHVPLMGPSGHHHEPLCIAALHRGIIDVGPMTLARSDPVGLLRREVSWPDRQTIFVHPVTVGLPATSVGEIHDLEGMPSETVVPADLAFHAIREYVPGDSLRHVHWKSTAKVGRLMVREYEESRRSRLAVLLGLAENDYLDDDELELAVSVAASLAAQGIRDGRDMYVATSGEPPRLARTATVSIRSLPVLTARALLDSTCELEASPRATRLEDLTTVAGQSAPGMTMAFLVTGSIPELTRLASACTGLPGGTRAVVVRCEVDGNPSVRQNRDTTVITVGALGDLGRLLVRGALG
ncbi:MAG: DUF58 domain-containing protein [Micrococcales bacterium]|nr:DUF58 domain-containing protein [Micrococcales bacterium]MCL2666983.1 DUF58 domain-containing protein [Micrococcales bacterium]